MARFPLTDGAGWRALRWLGRVASLLAAWPLWYAFFGKPQLDWEALMVGLPGVLIGLLLWAWAGYRLRNPSVCLEIDRHAGVARLRRDDAEPITCKLDALGAWTYATWTSTSGTGSNRTTSTWHAARCAGFAEQNLYIDPSAEACRAWASKVDAAARGLSVTPSKITIGDLLATRFDALIAGTSRSVSTLALTALTGACAFATFRQLARTDDDAPQAAVVLALLFAALTLGWKAARGPALAAGFAGMIGLAFATKPWLAPVSREFQGEVHPLSPTSETHLYYVIPGLALCVLAIVMASMIEIRRTKAPPPRSSEPLELEPPRPEPPQPPG